MFADFFVLILDFNSISSHLNSITHLNNTDKLHQLQLELRDARYKQITLFNL